MLIGHHRLTDELFPAAAIFCSPYALCCVHCLMLSVYCFLGLPRVLCGFLPRSLSYLPAMISAKGVQSMNVYVCERIQVTRALCQVLILTTNLAECVCVCAKCDPFLPLRFHFFFKLPEKKIRIAKFPYAAFGPLFAFHCPIFFTKNNTLNGVCMLNVTAAH